VNEDEMLLVYEEDKGEAEARSDDDDELPTDPTSPDAESE
jgi:hypothetical protein